MDAPTIIKPDRKPGPTPSDTWIQDDSTDGIYPTTADPEPSEPKPDDLTWLEPDPEPIHDAVCFGWILPGTPLRLFDLSTGRERGVCLGLDGATSRAIELGLTRFAVKAVSVPRSCGRRSA